MLAPLTPICIGNFAQLSGMAPKKRLYPERPQQHKQKARFGILSTLSGGTLRDEAAFSHGVDLTVIAVGAK